MTQNLLLGLIKALIYCLKDLIYVLVLICTFIATIWVALQNYRAFFHSFARFGRLHFGKFPRPWDDTAATYCPGRPSQIVLKSTTKHCNSGKKRSVLCTTGSKQPHRPVLTLYFKSAIMITMTTSFMLPLTTIWVASETRESSYQPWSLGINQTMEKHTS